MNYKKNILFLSILIIFFSPIINIGETRAAVDGDYTYSVNYDDTITITKYTGPGGDIVIPSQIDGKYVTEIGLHAFSFCDNLTNVTIQDGVETIEMNAFDGCYKLKSITLPKSVTSISDDAFDLCHNLAAIYVDENNQNYKSVNGVLFNKSGSILVLYPCGKMESIYEIPSSVLTIERDSFHDCMFLQKVTIPYGVTTIKDSAFAYSNLSTITLPDSITSIGNNSFDGCTELTNITIPNTITIIGDFTFDSCMSLSTISIPSNVTTIGKNAFDNCNALTSVTISSNVYSIGPAAFADCDKLTGIYVDENNQNYKSVNGILFNKNETTLTEYPCGKLETSYQIPSNVTTIGKSAFEYCIKLKSIIIPSSVTAVDDSGFQCCTGLTNIELPDSILSIGQFAFLGCNQMISIKMPNNITNIAKYTFDDCNKLKDITIPNGVTKIESAAFSECTSLTKVTIPSSVTTLEMYAFFDCDNLSSAYFRGNAPTLFDSCAFYNCSPSFKICYNPNNQGFTSPTWNGYNTETYADTIGYALAGTIDEIQSYLISGLTKKQESLCVKYTGPYNTIPYGDLDGNKVINSVDLALMNRYLTGTVSGFPGDLGAYGLNIADLNGDGTINSTDQKLLKSFILGLINKFPAPATSDFNMQISKLIETTLNKGTDRYCVKTYSSNIICSEGNLTITFNFIYNS